MQDLSHIRLADYRYDLPPERIAQHPLAERDQAKLLRYAGGDIQHQVFQRLPELLPRQSLLVFNDTKVIQARLYFRRATGALIELLLVHPHQPVEVAQSMQAEGRCVWTCLIGNKKRWKAGETLHLRLEGAGQPLDLYASWVDKEQNLVELRWEPAGLTFAELLGQVGELPLPPYIERTATAADHEAYQTVYSRAEGAVAAPTAGLHFTPRVLEALTAQGHTQAYVTLHVSAGTFLPVKVEKVVDHDMHAEQIIITPHLLAALREKHGPVVAVGTTAMRLLESLYWLGVMLLRDPEQVPPGQPFVVPKLYPYAHEAGSLPSLAEVTGAIAAYLEAHQLARWTGETEILIMPGYPFQVCEGLITNFHMPETTLMLLVAAFIGEDWRRVYEAALAHGYRFLSYGDSSLLLPKS